MAIYMQLDEEGNVAPPFYSGGEPSTVDKMQVVDEPQNDSAGSVSNNIQTTFHPNEPPSNTTGNGPKIPYSTWVMIVGFLLVVGALITTSFAQSSLYAKISPPENNVAILLANSSKMVNLEAGHPYVAFREVGEEDDATPTLHNKEGEEVALSDSTSPIPLFAGDEGVRWVIVGSWVPKSSGNHSLRNPGDSTLWLVDDRDTNHIMWSDWAFTYGAFSCVCGSCLVPLGTIGLILHFRRRDKRDKVSLLGGKTSVGGSHSTGSVNLDFDHLPTTDEVYARIHSGGLADQTRTPTRDQAQHDDQPPHYGGRSLSDGSDDQEDDDKGPSSFDTKDHTTTQEPHFNESIITDQPIHQEFPRQQKHDPLKRHGRQQRRSSATKREDDEWKKWDEG